MWFLNLRLKLKTIYLILKPIVQKHIYTLPLPINFFIQKGENHPTMVIMSSSSWFKGFWVFALTSNNLFHQCPNMTWIVKDIGSLPLSILHSYYKQKVSMMLQQVQATFIQRCVVIVVYGSFKLGVLFGVFPHSIFDMHLAIRDKFKCLICSYSLRDPPFLKYSPFARTWVLPSCFFFWPLCWVFCFIDIWQVFIILKNLMWFINSLASNKDLMFASPSWYSFVGGNKKPLKDKPMFFGDVWY